MVNDRESLRRCHLYEENCKVLSVGPSFALCLILDLLRENITNALQSLCLTVYCVLHKVAFTDSMVAYTVNCRPKAVVLSPFFILVEIPYEGRGCCRRSKRYEVDRSTHILCFCTDILSLVLGLRVLPVGVIPSVCRAACVYYVFG